MLRGDLEGHYYGIASGGNYNDDTGKAYLVTHKKDKRVQTLHQGRFRGGNTYDKGTDNNFKYGLSIADINNILK